MSKGFKAARVYDECDHLFGGFFRDWSAGQGSPDVMVENWAAWRVGDVHTCAVLGHGAEVAPLGSTTVLINGRMALRATDSLVGAGGAAKIVTGANTVLIGDLSFGMADPEVARAFCKEYCQLKKDWPSLSKSEREQRIKNLARNLAKRQGLPDVNVELGETPRPTVRGMFNHSTWKLTIKDSILAEPKLTGASGLAKTIFHEVRHAETSFASLRSANFGTMSVEESAKYVNTPEVVVRAARASPLDPSSPAAKLGRVIYDYDHGAKKKYQDRVIEALVGKHDEQSQIDYLALPDERDARIQHELVGDDCDCDC